MRDPKIVSPQWLYERRSPEPPLLLAIGENEAEAYRHAHLPGAIYLDTNQMERPPEWNLLPPAELQATLPAHGITAQKTAVLYGANRWAVARAALALLYAGVEDVRRLEGGLEAWRSFGYAVETGWNPPATAAAFGGKLPAHPEYIADIQQVRGMLADPNAAVVDVRTWEEHTGQVSGYDYIQARGRIAGSVWVGEVPEMAQLAGPGAPEARPERACRALAGRWAAHGVHPGMRIAFYCGTGWRAAEAFWYAHRLGWENISVYDGGWLEWSGDPGSPIESGAPPTG